MNNNRGDRADLSADAFEAHRHTGVQKTRVVILVNNPCVNDSRVIRQAESLQQAGYEAIVLARRVRGAPLRETRNGVQYRRLIGLSESWYSLPRRHSRLVRYLRSRPPGIDWYSKPMLWLVANWWRGRRPGVPDVSVQADVSAKTGETVRDVGAFSHERAVGAMPGGDAAIDLRGPQRSGSIVDLGFKIGKRTVSAVLKLPSATARRARAMRKRVASPVVRTAKKLFASTFVFEDVDVAMREQLLRLRPQLIHAHDLMTLPTASAAAAELKVPFVYDAHELEMHRNADYPRIAWERRGRLEKKHIQRAALTITVSDSIADHLRVAYAIERPAVILNAPTLSARDTSVKTVRRSLGLRDDSPLAIYVGSVTTNRGLEVCVGALEHYPELHFAAVGPRNKAVEARLIELAVAGGVMDRFHLIDPVAPEEVVGFVRDADVSVLPIQNVCLSYYYCMPNKLFESVLAGLPVAVADLVELRRFVERFACGVVMDETDPRSVAKVVRQIVERRADYVIRGEAIEVVRSSYSWPAQATKLIGCYRLLGDGFPVFSR